MAIISGLSAGTQKHLQLDAGVLCVAVTEEEIQQAREGASLSNLLKKATIGATKGGATFTATPEFRSLLDGVNGARGNYKNGQVIDSWDISLKATISEMTVSNLKIALANATETKAEPFTKQTGKVGVVASENYLTNIAWVGTIANQTAPMVILLKDVLNVNGISFTAEDKNTGGIELELKAHFDLSNPEDVPFVIYTNLGGEE